MLTVLVSGLLCLIIFTGFFSSGECSNGRLGPWPRLLANWL